MLPVLAFVFTGLALLWFGYTLFFRKGGPAARIKTGLKPGKAGRAGEGWAGEAHTCPVCSARLENPQLVKSAAFPSLNGHDRMMHIQGCVFCLGGENPRPRTCPVCHSPLAKEDYLFARVFQRPSRKPHVHVLGCRYCRGPRAMR
ncbi:MAG: hypothetical protein LBL70_04635 [Treponema sp.]|jgi:hypothetical protein|nr:hypothetical protein [Treponema sp.]